MFCRNFCRKHFGSLVYGSARTLDLSINQQQTIFALCTGPSEQSSISIWRISGPNAKNIAESLCPDLKSNLQPRRAHLVTWKDDDRNIIDSGLCLYFPGPHSYTGQDIIEFHTHSSPAVIQHLYHVFNKYDSVREAEPGEFSKRALMNEKMDLMQVEGLSDLMNSYTLDQKKLALQQMNGKQSDKFESWRNELISILAHMEANIDFGQDEDDVDEVSILSSCNDRVNRLIADIEQQQFDSKRGEIIRNGINIAIVGECNVGKSSLLNFLMKQDVSIVTAIPGTTRDVIERNLLLNGVAVKLADTAGFRDSGDVVEAAGIRLSSARLYESQLAIIVVDASSPKINHPVLQNYLFDVRSGHCRSKAIVVLNKTDLVGQHDLECIIRDFKYQYGELEIIPVSIRTEQNTNNTIKAICGNVDSIMKSIEPSDETILITRHRHSQLLERAVQSLRKFRLSKHIGLDARTEDLRIAISHLAQLTSIGQVHNDEIIDTVFRDFCIGK